MAKVSEKSHNNLVKKHEQLQATVRLMREQGKEKDKNIKSLEGELIHFGEAVEQIDALK